MSREEVRGAYYSDMSVVNSGCENVEIVMAREASCEVSVPHINSSGGRNICAITESLFIKKV